MNTPVSNWYQRGMDEIKKEVRDYKEWQRQFLRFADGKPRVPYVEDDFQRRVREHTEKVIREQEEWERRLKAFCEGTTLEVEAYVEEQRTHVPGEEEQHLTYGADDYTQVYDDDDEYRHKPDYWDWMEEQEARERKEKEEYHKDGRCRVINDYDQELFEGYPKAIFYFDKLMDASAKDNCIQFVELTREEQRVQTVRKEGIIFDPSFLLFCTISHGAIRCAASILDGSTGLHVDDINLAPHPDELPPIFVAATEFLPDMVDMLDNYGARFDIPCPSKIQIYHRMIPLEASIAALMLMRSLKTKIYWSPAQSLEELICSLGSNTERELLTISLVMRKTPVEQTRRAMFRYAQNLNVDRLATLLYVDATCEHLGIFKQFSRLEYSLLVDSVRKFRPRTDLDLIDIVDEQQLVNSMELLLKTFYEKSFEAGIDAAFKMAPRVHQ